ncbi:MAG: tyrosine-type recombinase/integrase [Leptospirales bacterium]
MAKTQHFTQKELETLLPKEKPYLVRDNEVPGLVVKVYSTGRKTFFLDVLTDGKHDMFKIGVWPDLNVAMVREKAKKMRTDLAQGKNPKAEKKEGITLGEFFLVYMERHGSEKKSATKDRSHFERLLKSWQNYRLVDITRSKVESLHKTIGKETPVQANRVLALLSTMFSKAIIWGYLKTENPCKGIRKFKEVSRDRFLSGEELGRFFEALDLTENPAFKDFVLLSLFTGARKSNVLSMRWKDIDFERNVWKIPGELSKNGDPMQVPLGSDVLDILRRRRAETSSVFVLPGPGAKGHYMEPKRAWGTLLKRAKLEDLRIHDLRRSMGSWMTIGGTSLPIVGKALGHKTSQATSIYARLNLDPVRAAMDQAVMSMSSFRKKGS